MRTTTINDNLIQLTRLGFVNAYLVREDDGFTLVDTTMPKTGARIHAGENVVDGKPKGSWPTLSTVPDVRLTPGDRVGSLEVIPSPGHTPGHVAFLDTRAVSYTHLTLP